MVGFSAMAIYGFIRYIEYRINKGEYMAKKIKQQWKIKAYENHFYNFIKRIENNLDFLIDNNHIYVECEGFEKYLEKLKKKTKLDFVKSLGINENVDNAEEIFAENKEKIKKEFENIDKDFLGIIRENRVSEFKKQVLTFWANRREFKHATAPRGFPHFGLGFKPEKMSNEEYEIFRMMFQDSKLVI